MPDKVADSKANSKIHLITNCPPGMIASKIKYELKELVTIQKIKDVLVFGEARTCKALLETVAMQLVNSGFKYVDHRHDETLLHINQKIVDAYKFIQKDNPLLGWRILGEPNDEAERAKHLKNAETLTKIVSGTPSQLKTISNKAIFDLETEIQEWEPQDGEVDADALRLIQNSEVRKYNLFKELKLSNLHLPRPLCNIEITVCNILNSKGLGADVIFLVGFDQGKFPAKEEATDSEVYQMLVALTRAKKRIYLVNTIGKKVSSFIDRLDSEKLEVDEIKLKQK